MKSLYIAAVSCAAISYHLSGAAVFQQTRDLYLDSAASFEDLEVYIFDENDRYLNAGRRRVAAEFCNYQGSRDWSGGYAISANLSRTSTHSSLRVPAGECRTRSEILSNGQSLYRIVLRRDSN